MDRRGFSSSVVIDWQELPIPSPDNTGIILFIVPQICPQISLVSPAVIFFCCHHWRWKRVMWQKQMRKYTSHTLLHCHRWCALCIITIRNCMKPHNHLWAWKLWNLIPLEWLFTFQSRIQFVFTQLEENNYGPWYLLQGKSAVLG